MLDARIERWPIEGRFTISRGAKTEAVVVVAEVRQGEVTGRGECVPYPRYGETPEATLAAILAMKDALADGFDRKALQTAMAPSAARNALDCALLDLEAKQRGKRIWDLLGRASPVACATAYTISPLGTPEAMAIAAAKAAHRPSCSRSKLGGDGDLRPVLPPCERPPPGPNSSSMPTRPGPRPISNQIWPPAPKPASH